MSNCFCRYLLIFSQNISDCDCVSASSNLALKKPAQQVSDFSTIGLAGNAVDGYNDGLYNTGSCSHTNDIKDNWWKVDLKGYYTVTQVDIFSRIEVCCGR